MKDMRLNIFDKLSFLSLLLTIILLPLFFLPFTNIPVETSKGLLLVIGLAVSIIFWAIARFFDGKIILPKSWLVWSGLGVALAFLLSSLFSANPQVSLFGTMFDISSFWFVFSAFLLMLLSSIIFRTPGQAKAVLFGIILSSAAVLIFQSAHMFMPNILSLGVLSGQTGNIIGSWNALGLFAGFSCLMFLLMIEFFPISRLWKIVLEVFILLSVLLAIIVNFPLVWLLLGISALIIFVYKTSITLGQIDLEEKKKHFPIISFVVVLVSLLFFISGNFITGLIPNRLQVSNIEISPLFRTTMSVTGGVLAKDPVFGLGPNRFGEAWSMHKPIQINTTSINGNDFWNVYFNFGSGLLPTLAATTGVLGILSLLAFFALFILSGVRSVFSGVKNGINWEMMAFFVLSLYLFISSFFYSTGTVIFLLSLAFTGVFIGLATSNSGKEVTISFLEDHRKSFFSILLLVLLVIVSVIFSFKYVERFASVPYFRKALTAETVPVAENHISKAIALYTNDLYLRTYSQVYLVKLNSLANKGSALTEEEKTDLQASFDQAVRSAQMAVEYNSSNYLNFELLGSVYQTAGVLGVKDAYSKAAETYQQASLLNPLNPGLKLATANSFLASGNKEEARNYANAALSLKADFTEAQDFIKYLDSSNSSAIPVSGESTN